MNVLLPINRRLSGREARRRLNAAGDVVNNNAQALNEALIRLAKLESGTELLASVLGRGFWGRVKWLMRGK